MVHYDALYFFIALLVVSLFINIKYYVLIPLSPKEEYEESLQKALKKYNKLCSKNKMTYSQHKAALIAMNKSIERAQVKFRINNRKIIDY